MQIQFGNGTRGSPEKLTVTREMAGGGRGGQGRGSPGQIWPDPGRAAAEYGWLAREATWHGACGGARNRRARSVARCR